MTDQTVADHSGSPAEEGPAGEDPLGNLLELVLQRLAVARDVAAVKYASGAAIDDAGREQQILQAVASTLDSRHHRRAGMQFIRDQIEANKVIQRGLHHRWLAHPDEVPPAHPSLAADVRPKLDRITRQMVCQFERLDEVPRVSQADLARMVDERSPAVSARQLPRLHRAAALFAMRSLCTGTAGNGRRPRRAARAPADGKAGVPVRGNGDLGAGHDAAQPPAGHRRYHGPPAGTGCGAAGRGSQ